MSHVQQIRIPSARNTQARLLPTDQHHFHIPDHILAVLCSAHCLDNVQEAFPVLSAPLRSDNYLAVMHLLLYCEEFYGIAQPENLRIPRARNGRAAGLREMDRVLLVRSGTYLGSDFQAHSGRIEEIQTASRPPTIHIRLDHAFTDPPPSNSTMDICRAGSRVAFRQLHNAVESVFRAMGPRFLFPVAIENNDALDETFAENGAWTYCSTILDAVQRKAVDWVCSGDSSSALHEPVDFAPYIITGAAGTGKTSVVLEILHQLTVNSTAFRVLVCGHSDASVVRLIESFLCTANSPSYVFVTNDAGTDRLPPAIRSHAYTADTVDHAIRSRLIFAAVGAVMRLTDQFKPQHDLFTHIIVDDAGMLTEPETLASVALLGGAKSGKVVLVGDVHQLLPEVGADVARACGLQNSLLFRLLDHYCKTGLTQKFVTTLPKNYRIQSPPLLLPSSLFWEDVGYDPEITDRNPNSRQPAIYFCECDGLQYTDAALLSPYNRQEAEKLVDYWMEINADGTKTEEVGIITPFVGQMRRIENLLKAKMPGVPLPKVGLPSAFVNDEKDVILISCVQSYPYLSVAGQGFLNAPEMSYMALSRARKHVCIVGNSEYLMCREDIFWKQFIDILKNSRLMD
ncbi:uncharacterized protein LOC129582616 isoform X2 [Paramacrobiotus metropolitanus]|uniref:uncharacterized protein LOC129582616 isoform X2 n=1 Tax=Paramacrobiotus metropolitanus TaxID=2943436 RepID=UPI002445AAF6|nr:uncharacterized protein LOC129582616 isoform X2 [Paramacrobiotus metropolitanus]